MSMNVGTMKECRDFVRFYINVEKDKKGFFTLNQHAVANAYGLNSGSISYCLKDLINKGAIRKVKSHATGRPAVYQVVNQEVSA